MAGNETYGLGNVCFDASCVLQCDKKKKKCCKKFKKKGKTNCKRCPKI